ncbi:MAG: TRAP transporter substrate-binding protein DctP [Elusimicrobia bacterium]|nr:TRAP transporter substrate-binding protein DctP [Elusimicrobiota bacterium]
MTCFEILALTLMLAAPGRAATIKFATLAPDGTDAMNTMEAIDKEVREKTGGSLKFKFYSGGRQGDEKDMVRKIRVGQLQAGGFTGVGLGEVAPLVRVVDAPWLYRDLAEIDHIYATFDADFRKAFEDSGYILLGWTEVGFIYVFSRNPVAGPEDMKKIKIWVWEGDPIAEAAYAALGVHPIPLSITDVMTSLQTGLIDAVYNSPLYAIALQWHEKTRYIHAQPVANASGAVLISKKAFDALTAQERAVLVEVSGRRLKELNGRIRQGNVAALEQLKKQGLTLVPASPAAVKAYVQAGTQARRALAGRLYPAALLDRVEKSLTAYRAAKDAKK